MPGAGLPEQSTTTLRRCSVLPAIGRVGVPGKRCRSRRRTRPPAHYMMDFRHSTASAAIAAASAMSRTG